MPSLAFVAASVGVCSLLSFVVYAVHMRYLHPLAKFPGPAIACLSDFYKFLVIAKIPTLGQDLHRQYGPIVRIGPDSLIFNDPLLLPQVYHRKAEKTAWYTSWMFGDKVQAMFLTPKYEEHAAKKRVVGPACSMKALKRFEHRFDARVDDLCTAFDRDYIKQEKPVDFAEYLRLFLNDTFNHLAYGKATECVKKGEDVGGMIQSLQDTYGTAASVALLPWLLVPIVRNSFVKKYLLPWTKYGKGMGTHFAYYGEAKQKQQSEGFLDSIADHLTKDEVRAEYITFTAATLDGLAAFISPFIDNMISHPEIQARIQTEISAAEAAGTLSSPVAKYDEILALPTFQACILETLRRDAPAQTLLPRITPPEGIMYGDKHIPGNVEMASSPYIIHRNPDIFGEKPLEFRPERWSDDKARTAIMLKYGMWWGYGERKCAGENYAQLVMQKLCFEMLRRYKVRTATKEQRFYHEKWAVGMFWDQWLDLEPRA